MTDGTYSTKSEQVILYHLILLIEDWVPSQFFYAVDLENLYKASYYEPMNLRYLYYFSTSKKLDSRAVQLFLSGFVCSARIAYLALNKWYLMI